MSHRTVHNTLERRILKHLSVAGIQFVEKLDKGDGKGIDFLLEHTADGKKFLAEVKEFGRFPHKTRTILNNDDGKVAGYQLDIETSVRQFLNEIKAQYVGTIEKRPELDSRPFIIFLHDLSMMWDRFGGFETPSIYSDYRFISVVARLIKYDPKSDRYDKLSLEELPKFVSNPHNIKAHDDGQKFAWELFINPYSDHPLPRSIKESLSLLP